MNIQQALFLFFLIKARPIKQKISLTLVIQFNNGTNKNEAINILGFNRHGLAQKYRITSQISICNLVQNCIFQYLWYCIFIFLTSNYKFLQQVRWFITWWIESIIISSDSNLTQNIVTETIKVGEKRDVST